LPGPSRPPGRQSQLPSWPSRHCDEALPNRRPEQSIDCPANWNHPPVICLNSAAIARSTQESAEYQPWDHPKEIEVSHSLNHELSLNHRIREGTTRVAPNMIDLSINSAVEKRQRWHHEDQSTVRSKERSCDSERLDIIRDVFENIEGHDRIETVCEKRGILPYDLLQSAVRDRDMGIAFESIRQGAIEILGRFDEHQL
jgi:hypothetical protein